MPHLKVTIILIGDCTVSDGAGWGLGFKQLLDDRAKGMNTARGGRSSMSFMKESRWTNALAPGGDFHLIQFGHTNQPGKPGRFTGKPTFISDLARYGDENRAAGAKPILVPPLVRRIWDKANPDRITSDLTPQNEEVKKPAAAKQVPLVDLHVRSQELCESLGPKNCLAFSPITLADGATRVGNTHLNALGSLRVATLVVAQLRKVMPEIMPCFLEASQAAVRVESKYPCPVPVRRLEPPMRR